MARGIDEQGIKKIIDAVKEKPLSWTDLKAITKLPDSTLNRYLVYLETWKLIKKDTAGYWNWYERVRTYETEHDYKTALEHSKKLTKTLEGFFGVSMIHPEWFQKQVVLSSKACDALYLSDMLREHLRTGYPLLFAKVMDFKTLIELRNKIGKELTFEGTKMEREKVVKYVANFQRLKTYVIPKKYRSEVEKIVAGVEPERLSFIEQTDSNYDESLIQISSELRQLMFKVEHGEPLQGVCDLCPRSKVSS